MYKKREMIEVARHISPNFSRISPSKRGQVTIFIILGILLVLALILVIALKQEVVTFKPGEIIPTQKGKIENFISTCIEQVGEEALLKIGVQGGYIDIPEEISANAELYLKTSLATTLPYWAYGPNTNIPSLIQIQNRIDRYVEQHVQRCLFGMQAFQENYDLIEKSDITATTEITDKNVLFNVHWDVEIRNKAGEVVTELIEHQGASRVKLKKMHALAERIINKEMETLKLEDITQDLIALEHSNVPVAGIDISCSKKVWDVEDVKQTLLDLVRINVRELKIKGTNVIEFPEELTYYQNHYVWDLGEEVDYPTFDVVFDFNQNHPFTFGVTPLSGTKMKSSQSGGSHLLSFLCIQTWKFTYDLSYPVIVRITDEETGYNFETAFTVHVVRNTPYRGDIVSRPSYIVPSTNDEDYCQAKNIPMTVRSYELVNNEQTGIYSREPLEGVNTSFTCLRYRCEMGETEYGYAALGDVAGYTMNFPYCVGGILRGTKENYKENWTRVVTQPGIELELDLVPLFTFPVVNITILKHQLSPNGQIETAQQLEQPEAALIKITYSKPGDLPVLPYHESTVVKTRLVDQQTEEQEKIQFLAKADFPYQLDINVLDGEHFVGGYKGNWTPSWRDLEQANAIVFHVLSQENLPEEQMFEFISTLDQQSSLVPPPEIRKP